MKVGDKIICVDDSDVETLINGDTYTIREVLHVRDEIGYLLDETYNGSHHGFPYYYGYRESRFKLKRRKSPTYSSRKIII